MARPLQNKENNDVPSRRTYTFKYFFHVNGEKLEVCTKFYLGTLAISQKPVYTAHNTKNSKTNTAAPDNRGKLPSSKRLPKANPDFAREHIKSFPKVESHYCRATTSREYLESNLSVGKMYHLYKEKCVENNIQAVKESMYYKIFVTEFNLGFHIPKSDRCDLCEEHKVALNTTTLSNELKVNYERHQAMKLAMREERRKDKEEGVPVLLFDLENVIGLPRAEISSFFYLRKLKSYNVTAYYTLLPKKFSVRYGLNQWQGEVAMTLPAY